MQTTRKLVLEFRSLQEEPKTGGLHFVLFRIYGTKLTYDYGYAEWDLENKKWVVPDTMCEVFLWTILPSPRLLF